MGQGATSYWTSLGFAVDLIGAIALVSLAIWLWPRRDRFGSARRAVVPALIMTAGWCLSVASAASAPSGMFFSSVAETARNLAWLVVIYLLFASDGRHASVKPIRPVIFALVFVELLHFGIDSGLSRGEMGEEAAQLAFESNVMLRMLAAVGGLVLVHNLYAGAEREMRGTLRWLAAGLEVLWAFELNL